MRSEGHAGRVLLVGDEHLCADVRSALQGVGFAVVEAADGPSAVQIAAVESVDVVVLDMHQLGATSLEVLTAMRRTGGELHAVLLTESGSETDWVLGLLSDADELVVRPFTVQAVTERIVAARRRQTDPGGRVDDRPLAATVEDELDVDGAAWRDDDYEDAVVVVVAGTVRCANAAALRLIGATAESDLVGRDMFAFVAPRSLRAVATRSKNAQHGRRLRPELIGLVGLDGEERLVEIASTPTVWEGEAASQVTLWDLRGDASHVSVPATGVRSAAATAQSSSSEAAEIRRAIEHDEFVVHYQPIVRLRDATWVGAEALVRWQHPQRGLLAPAAFIEAAERTGAIVELGHVVLQEACRQWARWRDAGEELHMAVNVSGRQVDDDAFLEHLRDSIAAVDMPPGHLWLEITESALVQDLEQATTTLGQIGELGVRMSIDDFGTGWASLAYLRQFPVHALKIDRMFVDGIDRSSTDAAIVGSVVRLADELDLMTIAEGIETPEQRLHLLQLGCHHGQGYLFGHPTAPTGRAHRPPPKA